jgi:hypothetical protein
MTQLFRLIGIKGRREGDVHVGSGEIGGEGYELGGVIVMLVVLSLTRKRTMEKQIPIVFEAPCQTTTG